MRKKTHFKKKPPFKRYRKRYLTKKKKTVRLPRGLPDRIRTTLAYQYDRTYISGTLPGNSSGVIQFKLSSCFDPYYNAGGTQPPLYDNYCALYSRWRVNKVTMIAHLQNYSSVPIQAVCLATFDPTTNSPTFPDNPATYNIRALPSTLRSAVKTMAPIESSQQTTTTIKKTFFPGKLVSTNYFSSVNYAGTVAADPSNYVVGEILAIPQATGTQAWGAWCQIELKFDITFYDRQMIEIATND